MKISVKSGLVASSRWLNDTGSSKGIRSRNFLNALYSTLWVGILSLCLAYSLFFVAKSSVPVGNQRYFVLFDDAMVSMRYAHNWAEGLGPVWNAGERVEGYTNFAWTAYMALIHLLPLPEQYYPFVIQLTGVLLMGLLLWLARWLARLFGLSAFLGVVAAELTAFSYPLLYWTLMGMETGLVAVLITLATGQFVTMVQHRKVQPLGFVILALATLVRLDVLTVALALAAYLYLFIRHDGRQCRRWFALAALLLAVPVLYRFVAYLYYGDWLPNTFYLKAGVPLAWRIEDGLTYSWGSLRRLGLLIPLLVVVSLLAHHRREHIVLMVPFLALLVYQIWAGGDAWQRDRFLWPAMPGVYVLVAAGIAVVVRRFLPDRLRGSRLVAATGLVILVLISVNLSYRSEIDPRNYVYQEDFNEYNVLKALAIRQATYSDARIAVYWGGTIPYFAHRRAIDMLGKSDAYIAHLPASRFAMPGHNKLDVNYSIGQLKPDVVARPCPYKCRGLADNSFFADNYVRGIVDVADSRVSLWFHKDSDRIDWSRIVLAPLDWSVVEWAPEP